MTPRDKGRGPTELVGVEFHAGLTAQTPAKQGDISSRMRSRCRLSSLRLGQSVVLVDIWPVDLVVRVGEKIGSAIGLSPQEVHELVGYERGVNMAGAGQLRAECHHLDLQLVERVIRNFSGSPP
jgi:hypothetical protein